MVRLLAADIGGTKSWLALFRMEAGGLTAVHSARFANADHASIDHLLGVFLASQDGPPPTAACLAAAGPVVDGDVQATNIPWRLEHRLLAERLACREVRIVNDLEAMARGMLALPADAFETLNPGRQPFRPGNAAVLAVGTGLGEAILHWDGSRHATLATEGGHADFAPRDPREFALLQRLQQDHPDHVSWERVLSGAGLVAIHALLRGESGRPAPGWLARAMAGEDPASVIGAAGTADPAGECSDPVCREAVTLFARLLGAEAGNLALKCLAVGGVYIGGGIAPKILPVLRDGAFMEGFTAKGRFAPLMAGMRVLVARDEQVALLGAARIAAEMAAGGAGA